MIMKVAYLGKIQLSDVDLSYLHHAQQLADVTLILEVTPRYMRGPAFNIKNICTKSGLFKAVEAYPEFEKYKDFIDINRFYVLNTCGRFWQLKAFWTNLLLLKFLWQNKFDVIHWAWPPNIYEFCTYMLRRKMILTVHDPFPHTAHDSFIVRLRRKAAFRFIPKLILLNKAQRNDFISHYHIAPSRIIDSKLSSYTYLRCVCPDESTVPKHPYILFVGRISPYKGLEYLLPAMKRVHEACPDCHLIVAGSGKYHFDIAEYQKLSYIDIRNRFIPDEEMVALIRHTAFMICPYTDATQSGVVMSAYAFCTPVIATNVGGLPEMVEHERNGLIVPEKDAERLADSIISLWQHPELEATFSKHIEDSYSIGSLSWQHIAEQLNKEYQHIVSH